MKRDRVATNHWDNDDFAAVGVPVDDSGKDARQFLKRLELSGQCTLEWTRHEMLHSDGRTYQDVIVRSRSENPQAIANMVVAYLPDDSLIDEQEAAAIAKHR
jgi:hypothetical protein